MTSFLKKNAIVVAVGVSSLCFVGAAHAVVTSPNVAGGYRSLGDFGTLSAPASVTFDGHQHNAGPVLASVDLSADGQDAVTFSVASNSASNVATIASGSGNNGWASFATSLWDTTAGLLATGTVTNLGGGSWSSIFSYSPLTVTESPYSIHINGVTLSGSHTAGYAGFMILSPVASPVPEPETFAMMLAALSLMGFIARRRKQNDAAA